MPLKGKKNNPKGKGGFGDNPQNINVSGRWNKEDSIGYQYNMLIRLSMDDLDKWLKKNPKKKRTVAQHLAYEAVQKAKIELNYLKEVTDRTEGRPKQDMDITSGDKPIAAPLIISSIIPRNVPTESETTDSDPTPEQSGD